MNGYYEERRDDTFHKFWSIAERDSPRNIGDHATELRRSRRYALDERRERTHNEREGRFLGGPCTCI